MHDDEVETSASLVRGLVDAQFPEWADLPIEPVLFGGTDNALYRLGAGLLCACRGTSEPSARSRSSAGGYRGSPRCSRSPYPRPVAEGVPAGGYPGTWSVYRWLEGETATRPSALPNRAKPASDLADLIGALQRIDADGWPAAEQAQRIPRCAARHAGREHAGFDRCPGLDKIDGRAATAAWGDALRAGSGAFADLDPRRPRRSQPAGQSRAGSGR